MTDGRINTYEELQGWAKGDAAREKFLTDQKIVLDDAFKKGTYFLPAANMLAAFTFEGKPDPFVAGYSGGQVGITAIEDEQQRDQLKKLYNIYHPQTPLKLSSQHEYPVGSPEATARRAQEAQLLTPFANGLAPSLPDFKKRMGVKSTTGAEIDDVTIGGIAEYASEIKKTQEAGKPVTEETKKHAMEAAQRFVVTHGGAAVHPHAGAPENAAPNAAVKTPEQPAEKPIPLRFITFPEPGKAYGANEIFKNHFAARPDQGAGGEVNAIGLKNFVTVVMPEQPRLGEEKLKAAIFAFGDAMRADKSYVEAVNAARLAADPNAAPLTEQQVNVARGKIGLPELPHEAPKMDRPPAAVAPVAPAAPAAPTISNPSASVSLQPMFDVKKGDVILPQNGKKGMRMERALSIVMRDNISAGGGVVSGGAQHMDPHHQALARFQQSVGLYEGDPSKLGQPTTLTLLALEAYNKTPANPMDSRQQGKLQAAIAAVKTATDQMKAEGHAAPHQEVRMIPVQTQLPELITRARQGLANKFDIDNITQKMLAQETTLAADANNPESVKKLQSAIGDLITSAKGPADDIPKDDPKLVLQVLKVLSQYKGAALSLLKGEALPKEVDEAVKQAVREEMQKYPSKTKEKTQEKIPGRIDPKAVFEKQKSAAVEMGAGEQERKVAVGSMKQKFAALLWGEKSAEVTVKVGEGKSEAAVVQQAENQYRKDVDFGELLKGTKLAIGNLAYQDHHPLNDPQHGVAMNNQGQAKETGAPGGGGGASLPA